ncbi:MAG: hypothetical protein MUP21_01275 [Dehalococcoidia bacterium]|nr:hypothetical protein [Dehalococcoidia bacterium]
MTREPAQEGASQRKACPKCSAVASLLSPTKHVEVTAAVYSCSACAFVFRADGAAYLENTNALRDYFRGASLGNKTLMESLGGEKVNAATKAVLTAQLLEYGTQMWFDGLKQGLLLGAIQAEKKDA